VATFTHISLQRKKERKDGRKEGRNAGRKPGRNERRKEGRKERHNLTAKAAQRVDKSASSAPPSRAVLQVRVGTHGVEINFSGIY
jgi:hypothetical protein